MSAVQRVPSMKVVSKTVRSFWNLPLSPSQLSVPIQREELSVYPHSQRSLGPPQPILVLFLLLNTSRILRCDHVVEKHQSGEDTDCEEEGDTDADNASDSVRVLLGAVVYVLADVEDG